MRNQLKLVVLPGRYVVAQLQSVRDVDFESRPAMATCSLTVTRDELSFIGPASMVIRAAKISEGWQCLRVDGDLAFDQIGVISTISSAIAGGGISLFAVSSHDRDHFLVQSTDLGVARRLLTAAGCEIYLEGAE